MGERRRPVSTPVRALAAAAYVAPVGVALLLMPAYRQIRLIRLHVFVSLILSATTAIAVMALGSLRPSALELLIADGIFLSAFILGYFGMAIAGAVSAYQGRNPDLPIVAKLAVRLDKVLLSFNRVD